MSKCQWNTEIEVPNWILLGEGQQIMCHLNGVFEAL